MLTWHARRRTKLSQDPNNTAWSKSTAGFGHKILSKQGWKPGDFLGVENAEHSGHYTAANASHIKVFLREENLGLGAKIGTSNAETFGLSLFSSVLGRLNGKTDGEIEKQQNSLRDAELRLYQAQKFGHMNFVSGGLLLGDKIVSPCDDEKRSVNHTVGDSEANVRLKKNPKRGHHEDHKQDKLRTAGQDLGDDITVIDIVPVKPLSSDQTQDSSERSQKRKREKTSKRTSGSEQLSTAAPPRPDRQESKAERRARKADRRKRKEEKQKQKEERNSEKSVSSRESTILAAEAVPTFAGNRHAVRHRYIQHKRQAVANAQAMKEIFMLNAAV